MYKADKVVTIRRRPVNTFTVPKDNHKYWQLGHDWQTSEWDHLPRSIVKEYKKFHPWQERSLPDVFNVIVDGYVKKDYTPMSHDMQMLWFYMIDYSSKHTMTELVEIWRNVTADGRALTDRHTRENGFADYVTSENIDGKPMAMLFASFGGNLVRQTRRSGSKIWVETIKADNPPSVHEIEDKPWLWHWAVESTVFQLPDKTYLNSRWHWNFHNGVKYGTPFPFISPTGEARVSRGDVIEVQPGQVISPYNPIEA